MFEFNQPFVSYSRQLADATIKAQQLALENFESIARLQLKTAENRLNATFTFLGEAAEVRDLEGIRAIWPKSFHLAREAGEELLTLGQETLQRTARTGEAIAQLVKAQVEAANEGIAKAAPKAGAKSGRTA